MELVDLVRGAQDAMDRGDYRLATAASAHGLSAYPSCLVAHRILGEAHLELGDAVPATKHFEHTLAVDPLNVVARLGLGVACEEQKDYGAAYAHYLHAWEINPALDQVRDELVRLRGLLGVKDRLHPTRPGLAGIHARAGQLHRAANEWRAVLAVEPESRRARTSYAELLWRQGEDALAATACRDALRGAPENARALAILADIERRRGGPGADELTERYRAVDPTGEVLLLLSDWRRDVDLTFLATESAPVEDFDFAAHAVPADQLGAPPKIGTNALAGNAIAAPDLWDTLVKDLVSDLPNTGVAPTLASGVEPFAWNDGGPDRAADPLADLGIQPFSVEDLGVAADVAPFSFAEPAPSQPSPAGLSTADVYTAALTQAPEPAPPPTDASPIEGSDDEVDLAALFAPSTDREIADAIPPAPSDDPWGARNAPRADAAGGIASFDDLADLGIQPFSFDGLSDAPHVDPFDQAAVAASPSSPASPEPVAPPLFEPVAMPMSPAEPQVAALDAATLAFSDASPFDPEPVSPVQRQDVPVFVDPFVGADGKIDLTTGWEDLDRTLAAATPGGDAADDYADLEAELAAELAIDGIVPFDANIGGEDDDAWAPLTADDFGLESTADDIVSTDRPVDVGSTPQAQALVASGVAGAEPPRVDVAPVAPAATPAAAHGADLEPASVDAGEDLLLETAGKDHAVAPPFADWFADAGAPSDWAFDAEPAGLDAFMALPTVGDEPRWPEQADASDQNLGGDLAVEEAIARATAQGRDTEAELAAWADAASVPTTDEPAAQPLFDDEVVHGIPPQQSSGYTELLRHVDIEGLDVEADVVPDEDPFANPDATGTPLAFEDLLAVTSRDATGPLVAGPALSPFDVSETDPTAAVPADREAEDDVDVAAFDLDGVIPFALDGSNELASVDVPTVGAPQMVDAGVEAVASAQPTAEPAPVADLGHATPELAAVASMAQHDDGGLEPFDFEAALAEPTQPEPQPATILSDPEPPTLETPPTPAWSGSNGLGMAIGSVVWPAFVNQTSELIDRDHGAGSVFSRLRATKADLIAAGQLVVDRSILPVAGDGAVALPDSAAAELSSPPSVEPPQSEGIGTAGEVSDRRRSRPEMSEQTRMDLMAMRVRLIEDPDAAEEVAATVGRAVGEGLSDPLALRILGEAYLKLGRTEQAAAQFRQAMLARQRTR